MPQIFRQPLPIAISLKSVAAGAGSYAFTGTAATIKHAWVLAADAGSYAFSGTAANVVHAWQTTAGTGAYTFTGTAASVLHGWKIAVDAGSYAFVGTDATITKSNANKTLAADAGSYAFTGTAASILHNWLLIAGAGSYAFTGTDAGILKGKTLVADAGSYAFTGSDASLLHNWLLTAEAGAYLFTGTAADIVIQSGTSTGGVDTGDGWDVSDPLYYDWWRRQAKPRLKQIVEEIAEQLGEPVQAIREEAIEAITSADSLRELQALELLSHERAALNQLMRAYRRYLEDEEEAEFLLLH